MKKLKCLFTVLVAGLCFAGCSHDVKYIEKEVEKDVEEKVYVSFTVDVGERGSSVSRTAFAKVDLSKFTDFVLEGEKVTKTNKWDTLYEADNSSKLEKAKFYLQEGSGVYNFRLTAHMNEMTYQAELNSVVIENGDNELNFNLKYLESDIKKYTGTGNFEVKFNFTELDATENVKKVVVEWTNMVEQIVEEEETVVPSENEGDEVLAEEEKDFSLKETLDISDIENEDGSYSYTCNGIPSSQWGLSITFFGNEECTLKIASYSDIVYITDGCDTKAEKTYENVNKICTIQTNLNGGSYIDGSKEIPTDYVQSAESVIVLPTKMNKDGCEFLGWIKNDNPKDFVKVITAEDGSIILDAMWKVIDPVINLKGAVDVGNRITITCDNENADIYYTTDGTDPTKESEKYDDGILVKKDTKVIKAIAITTDDESDIVTANYTVNKYKVTFVSDHGKQPESKEYYTGDEVSFSVLIPTDVEREHGWEFKGWILDEKNVDSSFKVGSENVEFKAKWNQNTGVTGKVEVAPREDLKITAEKEDGEYTGIFTATEGYDEYIWFVNGKLIEPGLNKLLDPSIYFDPYYSEEESQIPSVTIKNNLMIEIIPTNYPQSFEIMVMAYKNNDCYSANYQFVVPASDKSEVDPIFW